MLKNKGTYILKNLVRGTEKASECEREGERIWHLALVHAYKGRGKRGAFRWLEPTSPIPK